MTDYLDAFVLGVHVTGAAIWVGGTVALGIAAMALRGPPLENPNAYSAVVTRLARRLSYVMWPALAATILTGLFNLRWYLPGGVAELSTPQGAVLLEKMSLVGFVVIVSGLHTFYVGPRIRRSLAEGRGAVGVRRLRRINAVLGALSGTWSAGLISPREVSSQ